MRFHSKEDHEELLKSVIEEHRIVKRIQELQVCLYFSHLPCNVDDRLRKTPHASIAYCLCKINVNCYSFVGTDMSIS